MGDYTVLNNIWITFLLFFLQPVFWVGLLFAIGRYRKRVNYTRQTFRVNFNQTMFEIKDYLLKGILPGIGLSILFFLVGVPLTIEWFFLYQLVAILLLIISGYRFIHPIFTFPLTSILQFGFDFFNIQLPFDRLETVFPSTIYSLDFNGANRQTLIANALFLTSILLFVTASTLKENGEQKVYPVLNTSKRGKKVASYQNNLLTVLPFLILVPGHVMQSFAEWWPVFSIGETDYALLLMPILAGYRFTVSTQLFEEATTHLKKEFKILSIITFMLFLVAYFFPEMGIFSSIIVLFLGIIILMRHRRRENQWSFRYGPTNEGLRIIAIRADSPAERLDLAIGDIILEMNEKEMTDIKTYNEVLSNNRSYIKMRIRRKDGEIVLKDTPLYDNDYNNLGLLILNN